MHCATAGQPVAGDGTTNCRPAGEGPPRRVRPVRFASRPVPLPGDEGCGATPYRQRSPFAGFRCERIFREGAKFAMN